MSRKIVAAGNWKMNCTPTEAKALLDLLLPQMKNDDVDVIFNVPFVDIPVVVEGTKGTKVRVGAQNLYFEDKGAYTGEISAAMLADCGTEYVVLGHSERREYFGETSEDVNKKVKKALEYGLLPIMCCGESLTQRNQGITMDWIRQQVRVGLLDLSAEDAKKVIIAYEPIWAIGTGETATAEQAEEVCGGIRALLRELYGDETAEEIRILYGGSVNGGNAAELFAKENIDGGLVGGASLKEDFANIVNFNK